MDCVPCSALAQVGSRNSAHNTKPKAAPATRDIAYYGPSTLLDRRARTPSAQNLGCVLQVGEPRPSFTISVLQPDKVVSQADNPHRWCAG